MKTLLIDGDNLLTIGFYGCKNFFHKGKHIGGIYHFLNTVRKSFETHHFDKIVVFWDGMDGSLSRKKIYPFYKENRKNKEESEEEQDSYNFQRERVKQYLEELYVRQGEFDYCESDDCIAHYVHQTEDEEKIIYSSDGDLTQLVNKKTKIFNPSHQKLYSENDTILYKHQEILIDNVKLIKIICGDPSDNIYGILNLGIIKMLTLFPEIRTEKVSVEDIIKKSTLLFETKKENKTINNLLTGVTKHGVLGDEFFYINKQIVNLETPILTDDAREGINQLIHETLDPEGRSYKNTMKMMMDDGLFKVLPKNNDGWVNFLNPFLRLTRKEKNIINKKKPIKIKNQDE